jgi:hypothetical protein
MLSARKRIETMAALILTMDHSLRLADLLRRLRPVLRRRMRPADAPDPEESRQRRAFVQDMLFRNPDAFASAGDVQTMMQVFAERF